MENKISDFTKQNLITEFENLCVSTSPLNVMQRSISVKYQFQRNVFEIYSKRIGLIKIENFSDSFVIRLFPLLDNKYYDIKQGNLFFDIDEKEYHRLKSLYFGNFKEDIEYLNKLNNLYK